MKRRPTMPAIPKDFPADNCGAAALEDFDGFEEVEVGGPPDATLGTVPLEAPVAPPVAATCTVAVAGILVDVVGAVPVFITMNEGATERDMLSLMRLAIIDFESSCDVWTVEA